MSPLEFIPEVTSDELPLQSRCECSHRVHTAKVYPIASPNGSSIIVYGHEHGLRILWKGGKPFKTPTNDGQKAEAATNGVRKDEIMILDSDDEEPPSQPQPLVDETSLFAEEDESHPTAPRSAIIQQLDLPFGTEVTHLAFPFIPFDASSVPLASLPPIVTEKIIVAAACSDNNIRVVALPLTPPSPSSKGREDSHSDQVLVIGGSSGHQEAPNGVAVTFTSRQYGPSEEADIDNEEDQDSAASRPWASKRRSANLRDTSAEQDWDLLVASISPELSGLLLVHRIPIVEAGSGPSRGHELSTGPFAPIQSHSLLSPASAISFSPCPSHLRRHSHLMVVGSGSAVRTYECLTPPSKPAKLASGRRSSVYGSSATEQGSWLLSLYPGIENSRQAAQRGAPHQKVVIAASWIAAGKAILALLADGEWGIWDIEGANPNTGKTGLGGELAEKGLQGGSKTLWSLSGWVEKAAPKTSVSRGSKDGHADSSKFAPRTPHTRRIGEDVLFSGSSSNARTYAHGGITAQRVPGSTSSTGVDEAVSIWYEGTIFMVPSLASFWRSHRQTSREGSRGNLSRSEQGGQMSRLDGIRLYGESISDVDLFPTTSKAFSSATSKDDDAAQDGSSRPVLPFDVLIAVEHRLVIASTPKAATKHASPRAEKEDQGEYDQKLISAGTLDVNGIDRVLATMDDNGHRSLKKTSRRVGFVSPS